MKTTSGPSRLLRLLTVGAFALTLVQPALAAKKAEPKKDEKKKEVSIPLFDPAHPDVSEWQSSWGEVPAGAEAKVEGKKMVVAGTLTNQSYGCIYRPIDIDIDKTPYMEIDVESVSHHWYLILKGDQLPQGYVKIQNDTDQTGVILYDLRLVTGLTGKQSFKELQLGISTEEGASGNKGQTLVVKSLKLASASGGGDELVLFGPQNPHLSGFKNLNDDRSPSGVDIIPSTDTVTLRANRPNYSYGMMYKDVNLDLSKFSILKVTVESVTHHWYLIMTQPELNKGYVRIQPDSNLSGTFYYDLADITGLTGIKNFRLQVGVSTHEEKPSALGETMTFRELAFLTPKQVPPQAKVLKKKDLKFQQRIQQAPPREFKKIEPPSPVAVNPARGAPAAAEEAVPEAQNLPGAIGKEYQAEFDARGAIPASLKPTDPKFTETKDALVVQNAFYRIAFSKQNGEISSFQTAGSSAPVVVGSADDSLWKIDTMDRMQIQSGAFKKGNSAASFSYLWDPSMKRLTLEYDYKKVPSHVQVAFQFDSSDSIDVQGEVRNRSDKTFLSVSLPNGLLFRTAQLDRVILPRLVGVAFKPGFFEAKKQWSDAYPSAFADFAWIGTRSGALTVYMVQPQAENPQAVFQPATLEIGPADEGKLGWYNHRIPVFLTKDADWKSPHVRLAAGRTAYQTIEDYARDNKLDQTPDLKDKLKPELFEKLVRSLFLKVDQSANVDFASVNQFIDDLPSPLIFHVAAFWPGGFDKHYPDYLPPDPEYGTLEDFKNMIAKARSKGLLTMPYTNPTWWNPDSPTVKSLTADAIAVKNSDGSLFREKYNGNPGVVVAPDNPKVIQRQDQTVQEFTREVPMDFLFHDQIGARRWIYEMNGQNPVGYVNGLIELTKRESKQIPLMTEGGFDWIMPSEIGFCGMTSLSYPGFKEYDDLWGQGNWEIEPISVFLAHSKVIFYQHNLSEDVVTDSDAKLTWNMAYGFALNSSRTFIRQNLEKKWIQLNHLLHQYVLSRMLGRPFTGFLRLGEDATWSRFGDINIFANHSSKDPLAIGDYTVAPDGFMAASDSGDLTAGLFTRYNGEALDRQHYLIVKTGDKQIEVLQPDAKTTFLTLNRPAAWTDDSGVRAYRVSKGQETEVPVSVEPGRVTFLFRADQADRYLVKYEESKGLEVSVRTASASAGKPLVAAVSVKRDGRPVQGAKVRLSAWKIGSHSDVPGLDASGSGPSLQTGADGTAAFSLDVPASFFFDAKYVWLRAQAESGGRKASVDSKAALSR